MDMVKLDTQFNVSQFIENIHSILWIERFCPKIGEFVVKSADIRGLKSALPLGSFVSLRDAREIMIVENHELDTTGDELLVSISGRSIVSILEDRVHLRSSTDPEDNLNDQTTGSALDAAHYIWQVAAGSLVAHSGDELPNVAEMAYDNADLNLTKEFEIPLGSSWDAIVSVLDPSDCGIRILRPAWTGPLNFAHRHLYRRKDRSINQTTNEQVVFSDEAGDYDDVRYLWTQKESKNVAYVQSPLGFLRVFANGISSIGGFERKDLFVDASDITEVKSGQTLNGLLTSRGLRELRKTYKTKTAYIDASISPRTQYVYDEDYQLGDVVTVVNEFNIKKSMVVAEYVRNQDINGETAYPTLIEDD